jgi:hypothetical protein
MIIAKAAPHLRPVMKREAIKVGFILSKVGWNELGRRARPTLVLMLVISLAVPLLMPATAPQAVYALTVPSAPTVTPNTAGTLAQYTIQGQTGNGAPNALAIGDTITIVFPSDTTIPSSITAANVKVQGTACTVAPTCNPSTRTIVVTIPVAIAKGTSFTVLIGATSNVITNPTTVGSSYTHTLATSKETTPVTSPSYTITHASASKLAFTQQPSATATVGSAFDTQPNVAVQDAYGNTITSDDTTQITLTRGTGTGTLQGTLTKTVSSGVATFTDIRYNVAETITIVATSTPNYMSATSNSVVVSPATVVDITLSNVPISWGTLDPASENNLAQVNQGNPATVTVESTTNVNVDIYIKGTNWSDGSGHTIGVENCKYDDDNTLGETPAIGQPENTLKLSYPGTANSGYFENVTPGSSKTIYFWISIPLGQWAGTYTNNVYIKAVKDGNTP